MYETNKFFERFLKFFPKNCPKSRKGTTGKKLENSLKCKEKGMVAVAESVVYPINTLYARYFRMQKFRWQVSRQYVYQLRRDGESIQSKYRYQE